MSEGSWECPSCGEGLAIGSDACDACGTEIGLCILCRAPGLRGTQCLECERGQIGVSRPTARRLKRPPTEIGGVPASAEAVEEPAPPPRSGARSDPARPLDYVGSAPGLLPYLVVRAALFLAAAAAALLAVRRAGVEAVDVAARHLDVLKAAGPVELGIAAVAALLGVGIVNTLLRARRIRHTKVYGERAAWRPGVFVLLANQILNIFFLAVTAGLALPWIYARNRRSFYRKCVVPGHANRALDFAPSGDEMLGYTIVSLLLTPLVLASAGLLRPLLSWRWVKWEQGHLIVPGKFGVMKRCRLTGGFGGYLARSLGGWLLSVATLGLGRAWALTWEWRWIARNTRAA